MTNNSSSGDRSDGGQGSSSSGGSQGSGRGEGRRSASGSNRSDGQGSAQGNKSSGQSSAQGSAQGNKSGGQGSAEGNKSSGQGNRQGKGQGSGQEGSQGSRRRRGRRPRRRGGRKAAVKGPDAQRPEADGNRIADAKPAEREKTDAKRSGSSRRGGTSRRARSGRRRGGRRDDNEASGDARQQKPKSESEAPSSRGGRTPRRGPDREGGTNAASKEGQRTRPRRRRRNDDESGENREAVVEKRQRKKERRNPRDEGIEFFERPADFKPIFLVPASVDPTELVADVPEYDWKSNERVVNVVTVRFIQGAVLEIFDAGDEPYDRGQQVIVETDKGLQLGDVVVSSARTMRSPGRLSRVIRSTTQNDMRQEHRNQSKEDQAFKLCQRLASEHRLAMKLICVDYLHGGNRAIFYFSAEGRVDFRQLVRELASQLYTRIEMRQVGVRDASRYVGGIGPCGHQLCCNSFLQRFAPVSIRMAKTQNLVLNPQKVSGVCGRLMCCLTYEQKGYEELRKGLPRAGKRVSLLDGTAARVRDVDVLRRRVRVQLEDGSFSIVTPEEIAPPTRDGRPPTPEDRPPARDGRPPTPEARPPARDGRPPARDGRPPARDGRPPARDGRPLARDGRPPARDGRPPARDATRDQPRAQEGELEGQPPTQIEQPTTHDQNTKSQLAKPPERGDSALVADAPEPEPEAADRGQEGEPVAASGAEAQRADDTVPLVADAPEPEPEPEPADRGQESEPVAAGGAEAQRADDAAPPAADDESEPDQDRN